jgi:hypothetical protein
MDFRFRGNDVKLNVDTPQVGSQSQSSFQRKLESHFFNTLE